MLHTPKLYSFIHRFHHKSFAPNVFEVLCGNPIEDILAMILMFVPCILTSVSGLEVAIAMGGISISSIWTHSGLDLPGVRHHDQHHRNTTVNFGQLTPFWDWVMQTKK